MKVRFELRSLNYSALANGSHWTGLLHSKAKQFNTRLVLETSKIERMVARILTRDFAEKKFGIVIIAFASCWAIRVRTVPGIAIPGFSLVAPNRLRPAFQMVTSGMKPAKIRALIKAIESGKIPDGMTVEDLDAIRDSKGRTALDAAVKFGHYPPGTTARDLASHGCLHSAAANCTLPNGTTVRDLAECRETQMPGIEGFTALHAAAEAGCLPDDTTAQDLMAVKDDEGHRAIDDLAKSFPESPDQVPMVLQNTKASYMAELKAIGEVLNKKNPQAVAVWMAAEIQRLRK